MPAARRLAIQAQGLEEAWELPPGKAGTARLIERLGYVQIDTISVVARAHHHVIWSRQADYAPEMLYELLARDRLVFEYWTHAASYIPIRDYRYSIPGMKAYAERPRTRQWLEEHQPLVDEVLNQIRMEGPQASVDFRAPEGFKRGTWWSWKPAKRALEVLFSMGELMVAERRSFQRVYDLRERVLPPDIDTRVPSPEETARYSLRRALGGFGVAARNHLTWRRGAGLGDALDELVEAGEVAKVQIDGWADRPAYAFSASLRDLDQGPATPMLHILSPFDNLVINRGRLAQLFGFQYRLEAYTPASKRRYGYFSLPILWGHSFVGRVDCKADRKNNALLVRRLVFEPDPADTDAVQTALAARLWQFAAFNSCTEVRVEHVEPERLYDPLVRELARRAWSSQSGVNA